MFKSIQVMAVAVAISGAAAFSGAAFAGGKVSPMTVEGATTVDTAQARELFEKEVLFVDVRKNSDWDAGRIPGALHLELKSNFSDETLSAEMKKDEEAVIYCNGESCMRSSNATKMAVGWGFSKLYYYRDGFPAWKAANNPVE